MSKNVLLVTGALSGLGVLSELRLTGNKLTTLQWNIFDPSDFAGNDGHPGKCLIMSLSCDNCLHSHVSSVHVLCTEN